MTYSIIDNGDLIASFDQEEPALASLDRLVTAEHQAAERLLLVSFDDHGNVVADRAHGERVGQHA